MAALVLDFVGGWLSGRYVSNIFVCILAGITSGVIASIAGAFLLSLVGDGVFTQREIAVRAVSGLIWHSLFALIVALVVRHRRRKSQIVAGNSP